MTFLRLMALLEGSSLLLLLFVAMPLKYQFGMPEVVSWVGQLHGALFVIFNIVLIYNVIHSSRKCNSFNFPEHLIRCSES
jgi:integral membrane protein